MPLREELTHTNKCFPTCFMFSFLYIDKKWLPPPPPIWKLSSCCFFALFFLYPAQTVNMPIMDLQTVTESSHTAAALVGIAAKALPAYITLHVIRIKNRTAMDDHPWKGIILNVSQISVFQRYSLNCPSLNLLEVILLNYYLKHFCPQHQNTSKLSVLQDFSGFFPPTESWLVLHPPNISYAALYFSIDTYT